jgi:hypothetical protein
VEQLLLPSQKERLHWFSKNCFSCSPGINNIVLNLFNIFHPKPIAMKRTIYLLASALFLVLISCGPRENRQQEPPQDQQEEYQTDTIPDHQDPYIDQETGDATTASPEWSKAPELSAEKVSTPKFEKAEKDEIPPKERKVEHKERKAEEVN